MPAAPQLVPQAPRLSVQRLSVAFGGHRALQDLHLDLVPGRIVALVGANGSGKSTTVKALTGINPVEPGAEMLWQGREVPTSRLSPTAAARLGIRVVHQEAPLVGDLTVDEMMGLRSGFPTRAGFIRRTQLAADADRHLAAYGVRIDPRTLCRDLTPAQRASVSLAVELADIRADEAVLILDEATASLSTAEADRFLERVRYAADHGLAVLMVTHRLAEVRNYADETVVLRDGAVVARFEADAFDEVGVVHAMIGRESDLDRPEARASRVSARDAAIVVTGLAGNGIAGVDLAVRAGEIVGVTGRPGGGASELLRLAGGMEEIHDGLVEVAGAPAVIRGPRDAIDLGVYYLSADRLTEGGVLTLSVAENLTLPKAERYGLSQRRADADIQRMMTLLDVRPRDASVAFGSLSGGNQQKVILGRWLLLSPRLLLLDDPTVGVDPQTRAVIFATLQSLAAEGTSVLIRSSEPEQLARLCSRVLVLQDGRIVDELVGEHVTTEEISLAAYA